MPDDDDRTRRLAAHWLQPRSEPAPRQRQRAPYWLTAVDMRQLLALADEHRFTFDERTRRYTCTIKLDPWMPPITGEGRDRLDAFWDAFCQVWEYE